MIEKMNTPNTSEELRKEELASAAVWYDGEIFTGPNHGEAFAALEKAHPNIEDEKKVKDGFTTTEGRFVDMKEALEIAKRSGMVSQETTTGEFGSHVLNKK